METELKTHDARCVCTDNKVNSCMKDTRWNWSDPAMKTMEMLERDTRKILSTLFQQQTVCYCMWAYARNQHKDANTHANTHKAGSKGQR